MFPRALPSQAQSIGCGERRQRPRSFTVVDVITAWTPAPLVFLAGIHF